MARLIRSLSNVYQFPSAVERDRKALRDRRAEESALWAAVGRIERLLERLLRAQ